MCVACSKVALQHDVHRTKVERAKKANQARAGAGGRIRQPGGHPEIVFPLVKRPGVGRITNQKSETSAAFVVRAFPTTSAGIAGLSLCISSGD